MHIYLYLYTYICIYIIYISPLCEFPFPVHILINSPFIQCSPAIQFHLNVPAVICYMARENSYKPLLCASCYRKTLRIK